MQRILSPTLSTLLLALACGGTDEPPPATGGSGGQSHEGGSGGDLHAGGSGGGHGGTAAGGTGGQNAPCDGRGDTYFSGLTETGANGWSVALTDADPAPPALDDNRWEVTVSDADENPLEGVTFEIDPKMPDHGHGTPIVAQVEELGDGVYVLDPINMFMPGFWTVDIAGSTDSGSDEVTFGFCVE